MLTAKGGQEITLVHYIMRMLTTQVGTQTKQKHLMLSLPLSSALMLGPGTPRTLS